MVAPLVLRPAAIKTNSCSFEDCARKEEEEADWENGETRGRHIRNHLLEAPQGLLDLCSRGNIIFNLVDKGGGRDASRVCGRHGRPSRFTSHEEAVQTRVKGKGGRGGAKEEAHPRDFFLPGCCFFFFCRHCGLSHFRLTRKLRKGSRSCFAASNALTICGCRSEGLSKKLCLCS